MITHDEQTKETHEQTNAIGPCFQPTTTTIHIVIAIESAAYSDWGVKDPLPSDYIIDLT